MPANNIVSFINEVLFVILIGSHFLERAINAVILALPICRIPNLTTTLSCSALLPLAATLFIFFHRFLRVKLARVRFSILGLKEVRKWKKFWFVGWFDFEVWRNCSYTVIGNSTASDMLRCHRPIVSFCNWGNSVAVILWLRANIRLFIAFIYM